MANQGENNIKLGVFVIAGLLALIMSFYLIGTNHNLFGSNFKIKVHFSNLNGLTEGNNVLFSGIQAGTVKTIEMINDTTIEVTLLIDHKIKSYIRKNAVANIGTEGLMGNKIVNIVPSKTAAVQIAEGDLLGVNKMVNTDEMLQTLSKTNSNIATMSDTLKTVIGKIKSSVLISVINDKNIGIDLRSSLSHIATATANAEQFTTGLNDVLNRMKQGKGSAGALLSDTVLANNLKSAFTKIRIVSDHADHLMSQLDHLAFALNEDLMNGKGSIPLLLHDSVTAGKLRKTIDNLQKGSANFNKNMEALKNSFLFRRYFKNLEKSQNKLQSN